MSLNLKGQFDVVLNATYQKKFPLSCCYFSRHYHFHIPYVTMDFSIKCMIMDLAMSYSVNEKCFNKNKKTFSSSILCRMVSVAVEHANVVNIHIMSLMEWDMLSFFLAFPAGIINTE